MTEPTPEQAKRNLGMALYHQAAATNKAEAARDEILQIVSDHIHRDTTYGGLDWDDLVEDLRRAGHTLPDPTEHPKEN